MLEIWGRVDMVFGLKHGGQVSKVRGHVEGSRMELRKRVWDK